MEASGPRRCSAFARLLGKAVLKLAGWHRAGKMPEVPNMVIIAAPHTSNWDFIYLLAAAWSFGVSVNWLGKDALFRTPLAPLLRYVGGIPVDRSRPNRLVSQLTERIQRGDGINLVIPPAGTRRYTEYWKSGFYRIAEGANIPMVCGYLDYQKKEAGLGPVVSAGNLMAVMDELRAFYEPIRGKYQENRSRIRLREGEDAIAASVETAPVDGRNDLPGGEQV